MDLFDIQGRKALITGATRGLGYGMAEGLMEAGAEVVIWGSSQKVNDVAEEFCNRGFVCYGVAANLADRESLQDGFSRSLELLGGKIDILINCAGIQRRHPSEEFPMEDWDQVLEINLTAPFALCQLAGREMLKAGYGKIINIASMQSFFGGVNIPAYASAKGGIALLTKTLCNEWAGRGINVNAIAPGYMATEMNAALMDPANPRYQEITARIPAHRWGDAQGKDMKGPCLFLASHASDYLNGVVIPVDGGYA
ncbi:MAG: SDR family oxidoreductase, partial [Eubacteriales bacterium]|nr:SDR family oxidoreductase [Eubacteriales bacterium]